MKTLLTLSFAVLAQNLSADEYEFFLVQRNLDGSARVRVPIDAEGEADSPLPVPLGGSRFQIWSVNQDTGERKFLKQETVGAYLPNGSLSISTPDPYDGGIPRTRIDKGFTLEVEVGGLISSSTVSDDIPPAAEKVLLDHRVALSRVAEGALIEPLLEENAEGFAQGFISRNGSDAIPYLGNLPGDSPTEEAGLEVFKLYALPDGVIAQLEIASAEVQVWPIAEGRIEGLKSDETYKEAPPTQIVLKNLYPESETYTQIYKGPAVLGKVGTKVTDSVLIHRDVLPRDGQLELTNLQNYLTDPGTWTLEILTVTPFGTERLDYVTFDLNANMTIRGGLHSLE